MSKIIGYFKVMDQEVIDKTRQMLSERKRRDSLAAEMTFFEVEWYSDVNIGDGKAIRVDGYKMPWEVDYEYFIESDPPYIMVRAQCHRDPCDLNDLCLCNVCPNKKGGE